MKGFTMKRKLWSVLAMPASLIFVANVLSAHHAGSNYDREHVITVSGTVTEFVFANPHTQIYFDAQDAQGNIVKWVALGDPPQRMYKVGWTKNTLKVGDKITVTGGPRIDGTKELDMRNDELTINGKKLSLKGSGEGQY
jgi:hypothetical protein